MKKWKMVIIIKWNIAALAPLSSLLAALLLMNLFPQTVDEHATKSGKLYESLNKNWEWAYWLRKRYNKVLRCGEKYAQCGGLNNCAWNEYPGINHFSSRHEFLAYGLLHTTSITVWNGNWLQKRTEGNLEIEITSWTRVNWGNEKNPTANSNCAQL